MTRGELAERWRALAHANELSATVMRAHSTVPQLRARGALFDVQAHEVKAFVFGMAAVLLDGAEAADMASCLRAMLAGMEATMHVGDGDNGRPGELTKLARRMVNDVLAELRACDGRPQTT